MKLKYLFLFFLILINLNCEKSSESKRKIKLSTKQEIPDRDDFAEQSTVLKFASQVKQSIAVLTFENQTGDKNLEWLCKGITDMLIRDFSQSRSLNVTTLQRIYDIFKQLHIQSPQEIDYRMVSKIGKEAKVQAVMKGSFMNLNDSLSIAVQLYNVDSGKIIQQEKVSGKGMEQIFAMIDELTDKVKSNIRLSMKDAKEQDLNIADISTNSLEAYRYYTEGVNLTLKAYIGDAIKKFERAIEIDSTFAMAYYWASIIYPHLEKIDDARQSIAKAAEFSKKALSLDESLGMAHALLGHIYILMRDYERGIEEGQKAVELEPNGADSQAFLGMGLQLADRPEEAIKILEKAIRLNPMPPGWYLHNLAATYRNMGRYDEAIA